MKNVCLLVTILTQNITPLPFCCSKSCLKNHGRFLKFFSSKRFTIVGQPYLGNSSKAILLNLIYWLLVIMSL